MDLFKLFSYKNIYNHTCKCNPIRSIGIGKPAHTTHDTENIVVGSIDTNLGSSGTFHCSVGEDKLESSIVNSGEVACTTGLMFFRAKSKRVHIDTLIRASGVALVRLHPREVGSFTLREAILAVELELGDDDRVLAPAVHVQRGLRKNESSGIRHR